jgi:hypothetical protein
MPDPVTLQPDLPGPDVLVPASSSKPGLPRPRAAGLRA